MKNLLKYLIFSIIFWPISLLCHEDNRQTLLNREKRLLHWYNADSRGGLFIHWGPGVREDSMMPRFTSMQEFEEATNRANWSPIHMVDAAVKLNCKYIIWATFHVSHKLVRTWKSEIPGTPLTKRDYLEELCKAAESKGIKVIVYMNGDAAIQKDNVKRYIDANAYAKYKNMDIDIQNNNRHWVQYYVKDLMFEIMDNYSTVAGFWCDGWNHPDVDTLTLKAVHEKNPNYLIFRNEYSNKHTYEDVDVMGLEPFAKILSPNYDKASSFNVEYGNGMEGSFIIGADWWYTGSDSVPDPKWCARMAVSSLGGNAIPCYAEAPLLDGNFIKEVNTINDFMKDFLDYANPAVGNVLGGGYSNGGFRSGTLNDSAYVATTFAKNGNIHFIHILQKPISDSLVFPTLGYNITSVRLLKSDVQLPYQVNEGNISIKMNSWNYYDKYGVEILEITTNRKATVDTKNWSIIANNQDEKYPIVHAIDSSFTTYYSTNENAEMPVEIIIKPDNPQNITGINVNQYEARALISAYYYPVNEGTRIRDYEVSVSDDGVEWNEVVAKGFFRNERGAKEIQIPGGTYNKQYIKLKILSNYKDNGVVQISNLEFISTE